MLVYSAPSDVNRDDYMLVKIEPPLIGQPFGLGEKDITTLLLSTRHKGCSLYPVTEWPSSVYVTRIIDTQVFRGDHFNSDQVQLIAWGEVFNDLKKATSRAQELEVELI